MRREGSVFMSRWYAVVDALRARGGDSESLDDAEEDAENFLAAGLAHLLGGHEMGMWDLTPAEEAELWDLASELEVPDWELMQDSVRAKSVRNRPVPKVLPKHPLRGGGHASWSDKPGKRRFPEHWSDDDAIGHTMDVARQPSHAVQLPSGEFLAHGERDGVLLAAVVSPDGEVLTAYPVSGPGVTQNPMDEFRGPATERLRALLQAVLPDDAGIRPVLDELIAVGEWPYVITGLRALDPPLTDEQRSELAALAYLADLPAD